MKKIRRVKRSRNIIAGMMGVTMFLTAAAPASAQAAVNEKEEVVYITADASGIISGIYVVNSFGGGQITDYGNYSEVKMLNTNDEIKQEQDKLMFTTTAKKVYYQGTLEEQNSPWDISVRYYLNGKEYQPGNLAGQSGKLEIDFKIEQNKKTDSEFFDNYALQAAFILDTDICSNIVAPDATLANVGSDKQLSYTILPGKGIDTKITADVNEFEMDSVAINGIRLNMDVKIDDDELMDKVDELIDGVVKLDDGAAELDDGAGELQSGSSTLVDGVSTLNSGVSSLDAGVTILQEGINSAQNGLNTLAAQSGTLVDGSAEVKKALTTIQTSLSKVSLDTKQLSALDQASADIKTGIGSLSSGTQSLQDNLGYAQYKGIMSQNGLDIDTLKGGNAQAVEQLMGLNSRLQSTLSSIKEVPGYEEQAAQLEGQIAELQNVITLLNGNNAAISGMESYLGGFAEPVSQLNNGVAALNGNYTEFHTAVTGLTAGIAEMAGSLSGLSNGINELVSQYTKLDSGINSYTAGVGELKNGYGKIVQGVSDLAAGSKELCEGTGTLSDGAAELYDGVSKLCDGAKEMTEGTTEMREQTEDMDVQVEEEIDEVLKTLKGDGSETVSFVSDKNTNVTSVQFVIKTEEIKIPEYEVAAEEAKEEAGFFIKLKSLFIK